MRLDPIYVVAPKPKPPSMPTRRAVLGMGIAFVTGGAIGGACGYAAGAAQAKAVDASASEELKPTGNAELDEVRRLAVKAPIEELMGKAMQFLMTVNQDFPTDRIAWRGVDRIAAYVVANEACPKRSDLAHWVLQTIDSAPPDLQGEHAEWRTKLRSIK